MLILDEPVCSVPELEELPIIPNPDLREVPSFLGQNYESRDCTRVLRSHKKLYHHSIHFHCDFPILHLYKDHPFST